MLRAKIINTALPSIEARFFAESKMNEQRHNGQPINNCAQLFCVVETDQAKNHNVEFIKTSVDQLWGMFRKGHKSWIADVIKESMMNCQPKDRFTSDGPKVCRKSQVFKNIINQKIKQSKKVQERFLNSTKTNLFVRKPNKSPSSAMSDSDVCLDTTVASASTSAETSCSYSFKSNLNVKACLFVCATKDEDRKGIEKRKRREKVGDKRDDQLEGLLIKKFD